MIAKGTTVRLGEVFSTKTGGTPPKSDNDLFGSHMPFVKPPELTNSLIQESSDGLSESGAAVARTAPAGSTLVSCIGVLGKVGLADRTVAFNQQVNAILPDGDIAIPKFVFYQALGPVFQKQLDELATGTTVPIVNKSKFNSIQIVLPPLDEQRRIVAKLDEALGEIDGLKRNRQAKIEAFDDVKSSMLNDLLQPNSGAVEEAWPNEPLESLVDLLDSKRVPITKRNRKPGVVPYYGATGVLDWVEGHLFDEPLVLVGEDGAKWERGERTAFQIDGRSWVNNHAHVLRPIRDRVLDAWLVYVLVGMDLTPWISGLTVPKLNQGNLRKIPIPLPPLDDQRRMVATLDEAATAAHSGQSAAAKALELADVMASSLMTELLTAA